MQPQPPVINIPQGMHTLDLSAYLGYYLQHNTTGILTREAPGDYYLYPNLTHDVFYVVVSRKLLGSAYRIIAPSGKTVMRGKIRSENTQISVKSFQAGLYIMTIIGTQVDSLKIVKK